ncbi:WD40/YVTN/BNR-like repeat-containing protein [Segetibacter sp. 3557_3]|uniref:WD40/YVTN/BNR-like repeat-containing protein n=1 Tax=Segetibacter sp. 3557_3 TaxID=2547429 RepID=UPI001A9D93CB|nr:sialidase family protein [Segetibacter sp. 3557_3]
MRKILRLALCFTGMLHLVYSPAGPLYAQDSNGPAADKKVSTSAGAPPAANANASVLKSMQWRLIGPYRGGRSVAVAGHPTEKNTFYMGTTGGGVWKTTDGGKAWQNVSDGFFKTGSVGAVAVSTSNPEVIYVGMGEHTLRGNTSHGDGVYKSTNGGKTWDYTGLKNTYHIGSVIVHPRNPDIVYVAAIGHAFGANEDRGVFRTKDGGKTWKKVLYKSPDVGAIDMSMDPTNPDVLYASTFEFRRFEWGVRSSGPGAGIHKSMDGGETWTDITLNPGLPTGKNRGRIGLAVSPAKPDRVWAIIEAENNQTGIYRTDDSGAHWQLVSQFAEVHQRPWYYHSLTADPKDSSTLWVMNIGFWKSTDGGKKFTSVATPHGDNHQLWIDPADNTRMIEANDGGATVTFDGGKSWSSIYNQPTAQMYHVIADNKFPYRVYGSQQDNSTISVPMRSDNGAIYPDDLYSIGGGESGYIAFDKNNPKLIFAANHHWITKLNMESNQISDVSVVPEDNYGYGSADIKYRFQWTFPIIVSPHNSNVLYATSSYVHRSLDQGNSWEVISPNLTRSEPRTLEKTPTRDNPEIGPDWGPVVRDNTGVEWYGTIFAFAESPIKAGVLWSGSDDGFIQLSLDNGKTWKNVSPKGIPEFSRMSIIDASSHDPATAYVAAIRYKQDDFHPYIYKTSDYGKTWKKITNGIPEDEFTRVVREDPKTKGLLYAGTEKGIYVSFNDGENWESLQMNLPVVPIHDLAIQDNSLVAATHGRSFWVLDNLSTLGQMNGDVQNAPVFLFKPAPTVRYRGGGKRSVIGFEGAAPQNVGQNPASGVTVQYYLKEKPRGEVSMEFLDASGKVIKSYKTKPDTTASISDSAVKAREVEMRVPLRRGARRDLFLTAQQGGNKFVWDDMRYQDPEALEGVVTHGAARGPLIIPGKYKVRLTVDGKTITEDFEVVKDPRIPMTAAEFKEQYELLLKIGDKVTALRTAVKDIRKMRLQLDSTKADKATDALRERLLRIEDELIQVKAKANQDLTNYPVKLDTKLISLANFVESGDVKPAMQHKQKFVELSEKLTMQLQKLDEVKKVMPARPKRGF